MSRDLGRGRYPGRLDRLGRAAAWYLGGMVTPSPRTLFVSGSPRSGTTWLAEVLASGRQTVIADEPLHPGLAEWADCGLRWREFDSGADGSAPAGNIIRRLHAGRAIDRACITRNPALRLLTRRRIVLKTVRLSRMVPWCARFLPEIRLVVIVRHPCAVVSSQMLHDQFESLTRLPTHDLEYVTEMRPDLMDLARSLTREEEFRALSWALDQVALLVEPPPAHWLMVSYEGLVAGGERAMSELFEAIGVRWEGDEALVRRASREAQAWSAEHPTADWKARVGNWRRYLGAEQAQRVIEVSAAAGVPGYDLDGLPSPGFAQAARSRGWRVQKWAIDSVGCSVPASRGQS